MLKSSNGKLVFSPSRCGEVVTAPHLTGGFYLSVAKSRDEYNIHESNEKYAAVGLRVMLSLGLLG